MLLGDKTALIEKVTRRISHDGQFGKNDQLGACLFCFVDEIAYFERVALEVPNQEDRSAPSRYASFPASRIQLCQRKLLSDVRIKVYAAFENKYFNPNRKAAEH